jgi:hypothetical protein
MTVSSVTANGCSFTQVPGVYIFDAGSNLTGDMWTAFNVPGGVTQITVNLSAGTIEHIDVWELSLSVLDTAGTGQFFASTTTGITINNGNAGAILLEATLCTTIGTMSGAFTQDAATNGNPCGHDIPGDTTGHAPTLASSGYLCWGASFKDFVSTGKVSVSNLAGLYPKILTSGGGRAV